MILMKEGKIKPIFSRQKKMTTEPAPPKDPSESGPDHLRTL